MSLFSKLLAQKALEQELTLNSYGGEERKPSLSSDEFESLKRDIRAGKEWSVGWMIRRRHLSSSEKDQLLSLAEKVGGEVEKTVRHYLIED